MGRNEGEQLLQQNCDSLALGTRLAFRAMALKGPVSGPTLGRKSGEEMEQLFMPDCAVWLGRKSCDPWGWPHTGMHGSMRLDCLGSDPDFASY